MDEPPSLSLFAEEPEPLPGDPLPPAHPPRETPRPGIREAILRFLEQEL